MRRFLAERHGHDAAASLGRKLAALRAFFRYLVREGVLEADPSAGIPAPRTPRRLPRPLALLGLLGQLLVAFIELNLLWLVYLGEVIAAWLGRQSEFQADAHAAAWGFAEPLGEALAITYRGSPPRHRLVRLFDEHPPTP